MIFKRVRLEIAKKTIKSLKESFARVVSFLEKGGTLDPRVLEELRQGMSAVSSIFPGTVISMKKRGREFCCWKTR